MDFVLALNMTRRHLTPSQKAIVGLKALPFYEQEAKERQKQAGGDRGNQYTGGKMAVRARLPQAAKGKARDDAAKTVGVSARYISDAKAVNEKAPELTDKVKDGVITLPEAKKLAKMEPEKREKIIEKVENGEAKSITDAGRQIKKEKVKDAPAIQGKYRVFYADPPWKYGNTMPDYFTEQADHYPLMTITELCEIPIKELAEEDAVLFLWVTSPILEESFQVIKAWSFKYKASFVWDKIKHNMGHYNSVRHEFLLICTRGSCQPDVQKLYDSVVSVERTKHSEKPEAFREIIDTIYPYGNRIELFARQRTENWDAYGNEI